MILGEFWEGFCYRLLDRRIMNILSIGIDTSISINVDIVPPFDIVYWLSVVFEDLDHALGWDCRSMIVKKEDLRLVEGQESDYQTSLIEWDSGSFQYLRLMLGCLMLETAKPWIHGLEEL